MRSVKAFTRNGSYIFRSMKITYRCHFLREICLRWVLLICFWWEKLLCVLEKKVQCCGRRVAWLRILTYVAHTTVLKSVKFTFFTPNSRLLSIPVLERVWRAGCWKMANLITRQSNLSNFGSTNTLTKKTPFQQNLSLWETLVSAPQFSILDIKWLLLVSQSLTCLIPALFIAAWYLEQKDITDVVQGILGKFQVSALCS